MHYAAHLAHSGRVTTRVGAGIHRGRNSMAALRLTMRQRLEWCAQRKQQLDHRIRGVWRGRNGPHLQRLTVGLDKQPWHFLSRHNRRCSTNSAAGEHHAHHARRVAAPVPPNIRPPAVVPTPATLPSRMFHLPSGSGCDHRLHWLCRRAAPDLQLRAHRSERLLPRRLRKGRPHTCQFRR